MGGTLPTPGAFVRDGDRHEVLGSKVSRAEWSSIKEVDECWSCMGGQQRRLSEFRKLDIIGDGAFSFVCECVDISGTRYAWKEVRRMQKVKCGLAAAVAMEAHCLQRCLDASCAHVIRPVANFVTELAWISVMELCDGGDLWQRVEDTGCLDPWLLRCYFAQVAKAIIEVHSLGIVHRDLKAENFMIFHGRLQLIDFGTSRDLSCPEMPVARFIEGEAAEHIVGTPNFMAPESIEGVANDMQSDLWGLGCTLYQILLGTAPFLAPGNSPFLVWERVCRVDLCFPQEGVDKEAVDLIKKLVVRCPEDRLDWAQIQQHTLFSDFDWNDNQFGGHNAVLPEETCVSKLLRYIGRALLRYTVHGQPWRPGALVAKQLRTLALSLEQPEQIALADLGYMLASFADSADVEVGYSELRGQFAYYAEKPGLCSDLSATLRRCLAEAERRRLELRLVDAL